MSNFSKLSKGQKRCVLALFETDKSLKSSSSVTRKEIVQAWEDFRSKGPSKVGFPNWLLTQKFKNTKGYYVIPKPTQKDLEEYKNPPKKKPKQQVKAKKSKNISDARLGFINNTLSEEDKDYYTTLEQYGIPF